MSRLRKRIWFLKKSRRLYRILSLESGKLLQLTKDDVRRIKKTWSRIPDYEEWAKLLFLTMCENKSHFKKAFGFEGMDSAEIRKTRMFSIHSKHFVEFWSEIIIDLNHETESGYSVDFYNNKIVDRIRDLGRRHSENRSIRFDAETWLFFKACIIESICGYGCDLHDKNCLAWTKFMMFVVSEMKNAFNEGVRARCNTV